MKRLTLAAVLLLSAASPVLAANADQPHQNVDKTNDAGNSTGNSRVDNLNRAQLDENQKGAGQGLGNTSQPAQTTPPR